MKKFLKSVAIFLVSLLIYLVGVYSFLSYSTSTEDSSIWSQVIALLIFTVIITVPVIDHWERILKNIFNDKYTKGDTNKQSN
jgi:protein-S-isoprenylcysteine O-methyltransferase Ste14